MSQSSIDLQPTASFPPPAEPAVSSNGITWTECDPAADRTGWNPRIRRFYEYWLSIAPPGALPGRQNWDPLDIPDLMSRIWLLDVVREAARLRFRYRLVGTKEVETLQREVTGRWLDEVHPHLSVRPGGFDRFHQVVQSGRATHRRGHLTFVHHKEHQEVENCMAPLARDGKTVDMIAVCSVLYRSNGKEN
jgi:hypothetical protein